MAIRSVSRRRSGWALALLAAGGLALEARAWANDRDMPDETARPPIVLAQAPDTRKKQPQTSPARPGRAFRDCPTCPEMVIVPAGGFLFDDGQGGKRQLSVSRPFAIGKLEVTTALWHACVAAGSCKPVPDMALAPDGTEPIAGVTWEAVTREFLPWLSRLAGRAYRLPSSDEWEIAARAGSRQSYHFGDDERQLCQFGNIADRAYQEAAGTAHTRDRRHPRDPVRRSWACNDGRVEVAPVGSYRPNRLGLHDVHGNVSEWVADCEARPGDTGRPDAACIWRVVRGGSWRDGIEEQSLFWRDVGHVQRSNPRIGFRVARSLDP